jgi:hypothetical protein
MELTLGFPPFWPLMAWCGTAILISLAVGCCFLILAGAVRLVFPSRADLAELARPVRFGPGGDFPAPDPERARQYFEGIGAKVVTGPGGAPTTADGLGPAPGLKTRRPS